VRSLHAAFGFAAPFDPAGRLWDPVLGGGALLDLGVYVIDLARLLLGDPESVSATGTSAPTGVDAQASVQLGWAGGACGLLDVSLLTALPGTALVTGTSGYAELGPAFHAPTRLLVHVDGVDRVEELPDRNAGFVGEIEEVARCVAAGKTESDVLPLAETVATMRVIERARELVGAPSRG
jgi:predicted dehydrogenase